MSDTPRMDLALRKAQEDCTESYLLTEGLKLEHELNAANKRIKRLEELGSELRDCASRIGTVASGEASIIRRTQEAIEEWDNKTK